MSRLDRQTTWQTDWLTVYTSKQTDWQNNKHQHSSTNSKESWFGDFLLPTANSDRRRSPFTLLLLLPLRQKKAEGRSRNWRKGKSQHGEPQIKISSYRVIQPRRKGKKHSLKAGYFHYQRKTKHYRRLRDQGLSVFRPAKRIGKLRTFFQKLDSPVIVIHTGQWPQIATKSFTCFCYLCFHIPTNISIGKTLRLPRSLIR